MRSSLQIKAKKAKLGGNPVIRTGSLSNVKKASSKVGRSISALPQTFSRSLSKVRICAMTTLCR